MVWRATIIFSICFHSFGASVSLKSAYDKALETNESKGIAEVQRIQADEKVRETFGNVLPHLSFMGTYLRQDSPASTSSFSNPNQYSTRLALIQPLFHGFADINVYRSYQSKARAAEAKEFLAKLSLLSLVAQSYYDTLSADHDLNHLKVLLDLTEKRVVELKERTKIGRSRQGELLAAQAQVASLDAQVEAANVAYTNSRENFSLVTGVEREAEVIDDPHPQLPHSPSLDLFLVMVEKRPDIIAKREELSAAEEDVSAAKGLHWPSIDLNANYYFQRTGFLADSKWDVGITFTLPLFQGFSTEAAVAEKVGKRKETELDLAKSRRGAANEIRILFQSFKSLVTQVDKLTDAVQISDKNYKQQLQDYRYGLVTNLDVLTAMNLLQDQRRGLDRTHYQTKFAYIKLLAATGQLLP